MAWNVSAEREKRTKFPEEGRFFPSRWYATSRGTRYGSSKNANPKKNNRWAKQIIEHEKAAKGNQ